MRPTYFFFDKRQTILLVNGEALVLNGLTTKFNNGSS